MSKTKGFISEFKTFITRGNVIDLAVGVIIGGAFQAIVKSLVDDIVMPVISLLTKGVDFASKFVALDGGEYASIEAAQEAGAAILTYGNFISAIINFLIMSFVIFVLIKVINKISEKSKKEEAAEAAEEAPATKTCQFCKSEIAVDATRCPHCTSEL